MNDGFDAGTHSQPHRSDTYGETSYNAARKNNRSFISTLFTKY